MIKRRVITAAATAGLILALAVSGTLAYFTDEETIVNDFKGTGIGVVELEIAEPHWDPNKGLDLIPGSIVRKDPTVTNTENDAYVRMIVELQYKSGARVTDKALADKIMSMIYYASTPFTGGMTAATLAGQDRHNPVFTWDASRSVVGRNYYNYNRNGGIMKKGESYTLFTGVVVPSDWTTADIKKIVDGEIHILVWAEGIQSKDMPSATEAFKLLDTEVRGS